MCGIAGLWTLAGLTPTDAELDAFIDSLAHRGPDGRGTWRDPEGGPWLGHRRLSVIDLSDSGRQPMAYGDGRYQLTYNGEIYNYVELRRDLESRGHSFRSTTDSEVLLAAYAEWGEACLHRLNGMWAFAIWDSVRRELFLARDRFGIKPLHWLADGERFAFASELKAFLHLPGFNARVDHAVVAATLAAINDLETSETTLLHGVRHLRGGYCLTVRAGEEPRPRRWWRTLDHLEQPPPTIEAQAERFRELLYDACRIRLRSDVKVATSLSGGLDSSSVAAIVSDLGGEHERDTSLTDDWQSVFVACFPGTRQDERRYAEELIRSRPVEPVFCEIAPEVTPKYVQELVFALEEIFWVPLAGPDLIYAAMQATGVKVSLDGHGADEALGGYHLTILNQMRKCLTWPPRPRRYLALQHVLDGFAGGGTRIPTGFDGHARQAARLAREALVSTAPGQRARRLLGRPPYAPYLRETATAQPLEPLPDDDAARLGPLGHELYRLVHSDTLPTILRNFDRASMAHGVEVRMPFLDWRLVAFAFSLPDDSRIGHGYSKRILREATRGVLPERLRLRTDKVGFTSPVGEWLSGPLRELLLDVTSSQRFQDSGIWDGPGVASAARGALDRGDTATLTSLWPYLHAYLLMESFEGTAA
jgi:asparagine synthase (glutamine-hydrolysing)